MYAVCDKEVEVFGASSDGAYLRGRPVKRSDNDEDDAGPREDAGLPSDGAGDRLAQHVHVGVGERHRLRGRQERQQTSHRVSVADQLHRAGVRLRRIHCRP